MSEVTKLLHVTARFDGCFCDTECPQFRCDECSQCYCSLYEEFIDSPSEDVPFIIDDSSDDELWFANIRARDCCKTFGMGDEDEDKTDCYCGNCIHLGVDVNDCCNNKCNYGLVYDDGTLRTDHCLARNSKQERDNE